MRTRWIETRRPSDGTDLSSPPSEPLPQSLPDEIVFSEARPSDYPRIAHLHALSWRSAYRGIVSDEYLDNRVFEERLAVWKARIGAGIAAGQSGILASIGDGLTGFVWLHLDSDPEWGTAVDNLHVHPDGKGRGIGRQLMARAAERVIRDRPGSRLFLFVLEANLPAIAFYERLGGELAERVVRTTGDGNPTPGVRYVWNDPRTLISPLGEGSF